MRSCRDATVDWLVDCLDAPRPHPNANLHGRLKLQLALAERKYRVRFVGQCLTQAPDFQPQKIVLDQQILFRALHFGNLVLRRLEKPLVLFFWVNLSVPSNVAHSANAQLQIVELVGHARLIIAARVQQPLSTAYVVVALPQLVVQQLLRGLFALQRRAQFSELCLRSLLRAFVKRLHHTRLS
jgi:hypothetical protein